MRYDNFYVRVLKHPGRGCWEWTGPKNNKGYGMAYVRELGRRMSAHRASFTLSNGEIPDGLWVLHKCDNPACVKPSHLFLGTPKDNVKDMFDKGRAVCTGSKGAANPNALMTDEQVTSIRKDYVSGVPLDAICARYGITRTIMHDYTGGRSWPHLLGVDGSPTLDELKAECARRTRSNARLDHAKAAEIRRRLAAGELGKDLAVEFGVHKATVSDIKRGKIWV